jgi:hypothetical protein
MRVLFLAPSLLSLVGSPARPHLRSTRGSLKRLAVGWPSCPLSTLVSPDDCFLHHLENVITTLLAWLGIPVLPVIPGTAALALGRY